MSRDDSCTECLISRQRYVLDKLDFSILEIKIHLILSYNTVNYTDNKSSHMHRMLNLKKIGWINLVKIYFDPRVILSRSGYDTVYMLGYFIVYFKGFKSWKSLSS